tara:strand:- start:1815 stop:2087 length:273 start_codon:yes stop_codon:yes gene_type:complete
MDELILLVIIIIIVLIILIIYAIYNGIKYIINNIKYSKNERKAQELNDIAISQIKLEIYDNIENFSIKESADKSNKKAIAEMRKDLDIFF